MYVALWQLHVENEHYSYYFLTTFIEFTRFCRFLPATATHTTYILLYTSSLPIQKKRTAREIAKSKTIKHLLLTLEQVNHMGVLTKNSNKLCISYSTKVAKVTKNSNV